VALCLDRVSSMAMAVSWAGVGWLGRVTARWGRARGQQDGVHPLGVGDSVGGQSKREGEGSGGVCLGLLLFPSMLIEQDK
jgi:hypothetical protein